jgi:glutamine synthetase
VPFVPNPEGTRIEIRFPDASSNPYLAFSAILMAGLDGIEKQLHPGSPLDQDLYEMPAHEAEAIPRICNSLEQAMESLDADRAFLTKGEVFSNDLIDSYIKLKQIDITRLRATTHPVELELYYSL